MLLSNDSIWFNNKHISVTKTFCLRYIVSNVERRARLLVVIRIMQNTRG